MLLRPLFFTSFLIDDQLDDDGLATRGPVIVSSASSKTSIAAAFLLAQREDVELVGLTSGRSVEFVEGLGIYDRTVSYDAIDSLERGPATYVDVSGDGEVRQAVHTHFGDDLVHSMAVGATHWEEMGAGAGELPGPAPAFFFAPDRGRQACRGLGPRRARDPRRRRLAPLLRVDRRLAGDDRRRGLRRRAGRLARRARGAGRAEAGARPLALSALFRAGLRRRASASPWSGSPASPAGCRGGAGRLAAASRGRRAAAPRAGGTRVRPRSPGRSSPPRRAARRSRRPWSSRSPRRRRRRAARPGSRATGGGRRRRLQRLPDRIGQLRARLAGVERGRPRPALALLGRHQAGAAKLAVVELVEQPAVAGCGEDRDALGGQALGEDLGLAERGAAQLDLHFPDEGVRREAARARRLRVVADQDDGVEPTATRGLGKGRLGLVQGEVGDRPHLDPPASARVRCWCRPCASRRRRSPRPRRRAAPRRRRGPRRSSAAARGRRPRGAKAGSRRSPRCRRSPPCPPRSARPRRRTLMHGGLTQ